jgi:hypothetical protein
MRIADHAPQTIDQDGPARDQETDRIGDVSGIRCPVGGGAFCPAPEGAFYIMEEQADVS